jgi:hypothetical protein
VQVKIAAVIAVLSAVVGKRPILSTNLPGVSKVGLLSSYATLVWVTEVFTFCEIRNPLPGYINIQSGNFPLKIQGIK